MNKKLQRNVGVMAASLMLVPMISAAQNPAPQQGQADSDRWSDMHTAGASNAQQQQVQQQMQATQQQMQPRQQATNRTRNVSNTFEENVANNCHYKAAVRGTVREINANGAVQYAPDLRLQADLSCPNGNMHSSVMSSVRGSQFTREQLAQTLAERARIFVADGQRVCNFAPRLTFDANGRLASSGIAQSCNTARGGGPLDQDQPVQNPTIPFLGAAPSDTGTMTNGNAPIATPPPSANDNGVQQQQQQPLQQHAAPNLGNDSTMQMNDSAPQPRNQMAQ